MKIKLTNRTFHKELSKIAADKSISHRAALFSLLCKDECRVKNYLLADDCLHTLEVVKSLGVKVEQLGDALVFTPPVEIKSPDKILECGNSGTLMRLLIGLLACFDGFFVLSGDKYLNKRPMSRISKILNDLGANILGRDNANYAPLAIKGCKIDYFEHRNYLKSAQVKSALILGGLLSNGCVIYEDELSRDHTENLLKLMQAPIKTDGKKIEVGVMKEKLKSYEIIIPNDPSSAFFFAVLCAISQDSSVKLKNVLLNKTRIQAFKVLEQMGAKIQYELKDNTYEQIGDIYIESSELKAIQIDDKISWLIDEIPALSIAFLFADGISVVKNAKELRVKESDRIDAILQNYKELGVEFEEFEDGFSVVGRSLKAKKANIKSFGDHRIAMSFSLLAAYVDVDIDDCECVNASFKNFYELLKDFGASYED